jgi:hypothetical protein
MKLFQIPIQILRGDGQLSLLNATIVLPASSLKRANRIIRKSVKDVNTPIGSAVAGFDGSCLKIIGDPVEIRGGIYFHERSGNHG